LHSSARFCACLERIGFDGFGLYFSAGLPFGVEFDPLVAVNRTKIQYFWKSLPASSDTNWSLTIRLSKGNGKRLGGFTLYRKNAVSPLWMDLDVFTTTGFSAAVATCVERMQKSWLENAKKASQQKPSREPAAAVMPSGLPQSIPARSSV